MRFGEKMTDHPTAPSGDETLSEAATASAAPRGHRPLFFQRRFLPMWTALSLGAFTDNMLKQALSVALIYSLITAPLISNDSALPIVGSLFPIAMLIFSSIAGQLADKYETAMMFRRTKFIELLLMIVAAVGFASGNALILILALFLMGAQSAFFSPVRTGAMPKYFAPEELVRANAFCSGGLFVSVMLGIVAGGFLIILPNGPLIVSALLVVAALGGWLAIRLAPPAAANAPGLAISWNGLAQTPILLGYAFRARGVWRPLLGVAWYWSVGALVTVAVPFFVRDTLGGDGTVIAVMMGLFAIGAAIGATMASLLAKGRSGLGFATVGALAAGCMILAVYFLSAGFNPPADGSFLNAGEFFSTAQAYTLAGAFVLASISTSVFVVPLQAAVQRRAPIDKRARILAANNMLNAAGAMIGSLLVLLVPKTSLEAVDLFLAIGFAQGLLAFYMVRRRRSVKDGLYDEMLHCAEKSAP